MYKYDLMVHYLLLNNHFDGDVGGTTSFLRNTIVLSTIFGFFLEIRPSGVTTCIYVNTPVILVQLVFGQSHRQDFMAVT